MTVVAWHKEMGVAMDSQATRADIAIPCTKWMMHGEYLLAGAGSADTVSMVFKLIEEEREVFPFEDATIAVFRFATKDKPFEATEFKSGKFPDNLSFTVNSPFNAIGAGTPYAMAAFNLQKTPIEAVRLANKLSTSCGGEIVAFDQYGERVVC